MINFDEEIKKFQPSLEVDEAEDAIYHNDVTDVTEVIDRFVKEITDKFPYLTFGAQVKTPHTVNIS